LFITKGKAREITIIGEETRWRAEASTPNQNHKISPHVREHDDIYDRPVCIGITGLFTPIQCRIGW